MDTSRPDSRPPSRVVFLILGALMGAVLTAAGGGWWLYQRSANGWQGDLLFGSTPKLRRPASSSDDPRFVISPKSWASKGGGGAIVALPHRLALVIRQTESVHLEIEDLLLQLARATGTWKQPK